MLRTPVSEVCPKTRVFGHTSDTGVAGDFRSRHRGTETRLFGVPQNRRLLVTKQARLKWRGFDFLRFHYEVRSLIRRTADQR